MEYYRAGTVATNLEQIESMAYGQRYRVENRNVELALGGFLFCEFEADCSLIEPSLLIKNRRLHWAIPDSYATGAPLEGRPYIHGLFDCFVAMKDYYQAQYNIEIPAPEYENSWWLNGEDLYMEFANSAGFELHSGPLQSGDVLAFIVGSQVVNHAAIWLSDTSVYQHLGYSSSAIHALSPSFKRRLDSVWRHKDLM